MTQALFIKLKISLPEVTYLVCFLQRPITSSLFQRNSKVKTIDN